MAVSSNTGDLPPLAERRQPSRKRTLFGALAVSREAVYVIDCFIRDLSSNGARIKVTGEQIVPAQAFLIVPGTKTIHEAKVAWIKGNEYGLQFVMTHQLKDLKGTKLEFLARVLSAKGISTKS